jgi:hypothetical protein
VRWEGSDTKGFCVLLTALVQVRQFIAGQRLAEAAAMMPAGSAQYLQQVGRVLCRFELFFGLVYFVDSNVPQHKLYGGVTGI